MAAFEFMADVLRFDLRLSLIDPFPKFKLEESGHPADLSRFWTDEEDYRSYFFCTVTSAGNNQRNKTVAAIAPKS